MRGKELDSFAKCSHSGCLWPLLVLAARFKEEQVKRKEDKNEERKGEKADRQRKRKRRRRGRRRHSMNSLVTTFHRDKRESRKEGRNVMLTWKKEVEKVQKNTGHTYVPHSYNYVVCLYISIAFILLTYTS